MRINECNLIKIQHTCCRGNISCPKLCFSATVADSAVVFPEAEREGKKLISAKIPVILMTSILYANLNMNTSVDGWQKAEKNN